MWQINRQKFQVFPEGKILRGEEYLALLEINRAVEQAYSENEKIVRYASELCEKLVNDTNERVAKLVAEANQRAENLIKDSNATAANVIAGANQKSKAILDEAMAKRSQIFDEAKQYYKNEAKRGYEDGYATGKREVARQLVEISEKNSKNFKKTERDLINIVSKAFQRIVGELDKKELIINIVKHALKMIKDQKQAILKVSPQDAQNVRENLDEILSDGDVDYLDIAVDSRLKPGTCILETDIGVIDASIDVQMEAILSSFLKVKEELHE